MNSTTLSGDIRAKCNRYVMVYVNWKPENDEKGPDECGLTI